MIKRVIKDVRKIFEGFESKVESRHKDLFKDLNALIWDEIELKTDEWLKENHG